MKEKNENYFSYVLRIWLEPGDEEQWRFSLEDTRTGKRLGFTSLEKLMRFIDSLTNREFQQSQKDE
jgi:hypothetical protein